MGAGRSCSVALGVVEEEDKVGWLFLHIMLVVLKFAELPTVSDPELAHGPAYPHVRAPFVLPHAGAPFNRVPHMTSLRKQF